jgi:SPRY domain
MKTDEEWIYTSCGYGRLIDRTNTKAVVDLVSGGKLYISLASISSSIEFSVKTFTADRKILKFEWGVNQDFSTLFNLLHKQLDVSMNTLIKIHYVKGKILPIVSSDTPLKLGLKTNSKLICVLSKVFLWDQAHKSDKIQLLENHLSVCKIETAEFGFDTVLGNVCFTSGTHFWEIRLDFFAKSNTEEEIFIGVAKPKANLKKNPLEEEYWGFMGLACKSFGCGVVANYGEALAAEDTLGIKLEYKDNKGSLYFCKNKTEFGLAFDDVPSGVCPALTLMAARTLFRLIY